MMIDCDPLVAFSINQSLETAVSYTHLTLPTNREALVAFSMNHNLETVFGPIVIVQAESRVPVYFRNRDRPGSVEPSAIVVVCVSALVVIASVPKENDSAMSSRLVLVVVPHVPEPSPVASSVSLRSFTNVAIINPYAASRPASSSSNPGD